MKIINISALLALLTFGILSSISVKSDFYYDYNRYRIANHLDTIVRDSLLEKAACLHSSYMALLNAQTDSFIISHFESIKIDGMVNFFYPSDRVYAINPTKRYHIAENITAIYNGDFTADQILTNWINSPPHNEALLSIKNKRMGLGIMKFKKNNMPCTYVTLLLTD